MPQFKYTARNPTGKTVEGTMEAPMQRAVVDKLRGDRLIVMAVNEVKPKAGATGDSPLQKFKDLFSGVTAKDLVIFSRQLATMVSAGVPIVQGLSILCDQIASPAFKKVIMGIRSDIESGIAIADAMKKHP